MPISNYEDFPRYSVDGGASRDIFLAEGFSTIIYFEDAGHEYIYEILLSKLGMTQDIAVVCTGGKTKFLAISKEDSTTQRIFVCDKDYDDLTGEAKAYQGPEFVYLGRFCIENYLIAHSAILNMISELLKIRLSEIRERFDINSYWRTLIKQYHKLSQAYSIARKNRVAITTTKATLSDLLSMSDAGEQYPTDEYIESIKNSIIRWSKTNNGWITEPEYLSQQEETAFIAHEGFENISDNTETAHLCGKHLLRLLISEADSVFSSSINQGDYHDMYCRLISHSSIENLEPIKSAIIAKL